MRQVRRERRPEAGEGPAPARGGGRPVTAAGRGADIGADGGTRVSGRERHTGVDSAGRRPAAAVTAAGVDAARAAPRVRAALPPSVRAVYADSKYHNYRLYGYISGRKAGYDLHIASRPPGTKGRVTLPRRWVVERSLAWPGRPRHPSRGYEGTACMSGASVRASCIHHKLKRLRLGPQGSPFKYRVA